MRNGFLAASLITLALGGAVRAQVGYGMGPGGPPAAMPVPPGYGGPGVAPAGYPGDPAAGQAVPGPGYPAPYGPCPYPPPEGDCDEPLMKPHVPNSCFVSTEYLLYFIKKGPSTFPLVTSGTPAALGQLGANGVTTLFGADNFDFNMASGMRVTAGKYFGDDQSFGVNFSGFVFEKRRQQFESASDRTGSPLLARPFINSETGVSTSLLVAAPGFIRGAVAAVAQNQMWGAEANGLLNVLVPQGDQGMALQVLVGGKYFNLEEALLVGQLTQLLPTQKAPFGGLTVDGATQIGVTDRIATKNIFAGANVGLQTTCCMGSKWYAQAGASTAFGVVHQTVDYSGSSSALIPAGSVVTTGGPTGIGSGGGAVTLPGGLFTGPNNIGSWTKDDFGWMGEANVRLGYHLTPHVTGFVGYDFLYLSNVVRPGDQIDPNANPGLLPTSATFGRIGTSLDPRVVFKQTDFFATGFTFGVTFVY
jgi:hypothetical protein